MPTNGREHVTEVGLWYFRFVVYILVESQVGYIIPFVYFRYTVHVLVKSQDSYIFMYYVVNTFMKPGT